MLSIAVVLSYHLKPVEGGKAKHIVTTRTTQSQRSHYHTTTTVSTSYKAATPTRPSVRQQQQQQTPQEQQQQVARKLVGWGLSHGILNSDQSQLMLRELDRITSDGPIEYSAANSSENVGAGKVAASSNEVVQQETSQVAGATASSSEKLADAEEPPDMFDVKTEDLSTTEAPNASTSTELPAADTENTRAGAPAAAPSEPRLAGSIPSQEEGERADGKEPGPSSPFRVLVFAARTLNAARSIQVTLSLR